MTRRPRRAVDDGGRNLSHTDVQSFERDRRLTERIGYCWRNYSHCLDGCGGVTRPLIYSAAAENDWLTIDLADRVVDDVLHRLQQWSTACPSSYSVNNQHDDCWVVWFPHPHRVRWTRPDFDLLLQTLQLRRENRRVDEDLSMNERQMRADLFSSGFTNLNSLAHRALWVTVPSFSFSQRKWSVEWQCPLCISFSLRVDILARRWYHWSTLAADREIFSLFRA